MFVPRPISSAVCGQTPRRYGVILKMLFTAYHGDRPLPLVPGVAGTMHRRLGRAKYLVK
jgi:hypothetical protein